MKIKQVAFFYSVLVYILFFLFSNHVTAQTNTLTENFADNIATGWTEAPDWPGVFSFIEANNMLKVTADSAGGKYQNFLFSFSELNLRNNPFLKIKIKSSKTFSLRIDMQENRAGVWKTTNATSIAFTITADNAFHEYTYDFTGRFNQTYPTNDTVNPSKISRLMIYVNPTKTVFSGDFYFSELRLGAATNVVVPVDSAKVTIMMNQIGFESTANKVAILPATLTGQFTIKSAVDKSTVYTGSLLPSANWSFSNQTLKVADFTTLSTPGNYYISMNNDSIKSINFEIKDCANKALITSVLKGYYYWRASTPIVPEFGGTWNRAAGHSDTKVYVHASAASAKRPAGTVISSPRGWYDAGDYGKYIVNSGISTYTLLALFEHYPTFFDSLRTNIPESGNNVPDILDEVLWNVRWMLTMQDPNDGGVYHKLTTKQFCGFIMPEKDTAARYVVQKATPATLDFAAVMAVAARIFKNYSTQLPGLSDSCKNASIAAWNWANTNPNIMYAQPADIGTGGYGDNSATDEFAWAGAELYLLTGQQTFISKGNIMSMTASLPSWAGVATLGFISLANNLSIVDNAIVNKISLQNKLITLANKLYDAYAASALKVSITAFYWGSNSTIANEAFILLQAYRLTSDVKYREAAIADLDYILGKNPTGYCFVTGFGNKSPMHIHDRRSSADGITDPIPGYVSGGPNAGNQADDCGLSKYPSALDALSFLDDECSYSTNEIAINWNAPLAYVAGSLAAISCSNVSVDIKASIANTSNEIRMYPNPVKDKLTIEVLFNNDAPASIDIYDLNGRIVRTESISKATQYALIDLSNIQEGLYIVKYSSTTMNSMQKLVKTN